ncbi:MAG: hypothetical protein M3P37_11260 [Actinomycetota bacterium]|nr:hypothetical protein [Actinomycetota bacterium]
MFTAGLAIAANCGPFTYLLAGLRSPDLQRLVRLRPLPFTAVARAVPFGLAFSAPRARGVNS